MLEHFEVVELEQRWKKYKEWNKQFSLGFKFDKIVFILLIFIAVAVGAISWILFGTSDSTDLSNFDKNLTTPVVTKKEFATVDEISKVVNEEILDTPKEIAPVDSLDRGGLSFNEIGIDVSVDSGGFSINNSYTPSTPEIIGDRKAFSAIPKDEIIDFGNPPTPPKNIVSNTSLTTQKKDPIRSSIENKAKIKIQTSTLKADKGSLESKFYSTGNIMYSLKISEEAYNRRNYDEAIKWALISNEVDKNSAQSWILFAKANYKKGNKQDAIIALESFNAKRNNPEVEIILNQIKAGTL